MKMHVRSIIDYNCLLSRCSSPLWKFVIVAVVYFSYMEKVVKSYETKYDGIHSYNIGLGESKKSLMCRVFNNSCFVYFMSKEKLWIYPKQHLIGLLQAMKLWYQYLRVRGGGECSPSHLGAVGRAANRFPILTPMISEQPLWTESMF